MAHALADSGEVLATRHQTAFLELLPAGPGCSPITVLLSWYTCCCRYNLLYYALLLGVGLAGILLLLSSGRLRPDNVLGFCIASSNAYGLVAGAWCGCFGGGGGGKTAGGWWWWWWWWQVEVVVVAMWWVG
jgi:hypothetical protein